MISITRPEVRTLSPRRERETTTLTVSPLVASRTFTSGTKMSSERSEALESRGRTNPYPPAARLKRPITSFLFDSFLPDLFLSLALGLFRFGFLGLRAFSPLPTYHTWCLSPHLSLPDLIRRLTAFLTKRSPFSMPAKPSFLVRIFVLIGR